MAEPSWQHSNRSQSSTPAKGLGLGGQRRGPQETAGRDQAPASQGGGWEAQVWPEQSTRLPRHRRLGGSSEGSHANDQRHGETDF